jgi:hypothetical protein
MTSGIINGVSVYSMLSATNAAGGALGGVIGGSLGSVTAGAMVGGGVVGGAASYAAAGAAGAQDPNDPASYLGVIIPTVLNITEDAVRFWTGATCLFDPNWSVTLSEAPTLPVCMFQVTKITSTRATDLSEKRIVLYEPQKDGKETLDAVRDPLRANTLKTIVDNVVVKPVQYTVEAIVPFSALGRHNLEVFNTAVNVMRDIGVFVGTNGLPDGVKMAGDMLSAMAGGAALALKTTETVLNLINSPAERRININTLETMAENGHILKMKLWTGHEYKYVMLTGLTLDKRPTEDGVYRAAMTLREVPVLNITKPSPPQTAGALEEAAIELLNKTAKTQITPLTALTGLEGI